ncbi:NADH dehydrogenase [ubiquinone] 1 alpha subcomplex subunit 10, mitochondrial-like [Babylonia areolata]|uniref:NADH dehydrogenase [ubiquinone] 1 alpha subcomplex subunit 10, mitochondrial-like n=1 Tax=Babylonia areolata TaxID=304850 RepID=UPI003FD6902A
MALIVNRAISAIQPHARQLLLVHVSRAKAPNLPCTIQVAHLTTTHGMPAKRKYAPWPYEKRPYNSLYQFIDHTRKRFDDNTKIILIEGNIAVGKSWFGEQVAKEFDMQFVPDWKDKKVFLSGNNFDLRTLNAQLPPRSGFCDIPAFYGHTATPALMKTFGRTQLLMYYHHFHYYVRALEHLLNTGQGIVMERGVFSHMVFHNVLHKMGHLSGNALKYLNFVYDNTVCEMWRPHLVIYLDAPIDFVRTMINKRNIGWEAKSPIITDEFLRTMDRFYKEKYLPYMSKYSEVITYDMTDLPEWEIIVEELESLDLDTQPFDNEDKFKDWQSEFEDDYNLMRMNLAKKWQIDNLFNMSKPWDAPELMTHPEDLDVVYQVVREHPEVKYKCGYNPQTTNVLLKW